MAKLTMYICDVCKKEIDVKQESRYYFKKKFFHKDCFIKKLKRSKKPKYCQEEINFMVNKYERKAKEPKVPKIKVPKIDAVKMRLDDKDYKELEKYLEARYKITISLSPVIVNTLKSLNKGTYAKANHKKVSYAQLQKMFIFYNNEIAKARTSVKSKFQSRQMEFIYDLSVVLARLDDYNKLQNNSILYKEDSSINTDISGYLYNRPTIQNKEDKISQDEIDDFADLLLADLMEDDD